MTRVRHAFRGDQTVCSAGHLSSRFVEGAHVPARYPEQATGRRLLGQSGLVRIASPNDCDAGGSRAGDLCRKGET
jgi:hypothetical protein